MAPSAAQFVAMSDQDDFWYPDKLQTLLEHIGSAQLIYSDARVVARDGAVISEIALSDALPDGYLSWKKRSRLSGSPSIHRMGHRYRLKSERRALASLPHCCNPAEVYSLVNVSSSSHTA